VATFEVTEKEVKVKAEVVFSFSAEEIQFLAVAARYYSQTPSFRTVVAQLENAAHQAKEMERG